MGLTAEQALAVAKKFTTESIEGAGAVQGKSAYQIAVDNGFVGTEEQWLQSLVGASAYQIAVENGYSGTEIQWLNSLIGNGISSIAYKGEDDDGGKVYTITYTKGGTFDFTAPRGYGVAKGGATNQVLRKKSGTDYDTDWVDDGVTDTEFAAIQTVLGTGV